MNKETGYKPFFKNDGGLGWICPGCWTKLLPAFAILRDVLGVSASLEPMHFLIRRWMEEQT